MSYVRVKICGVTRPSDAALACDLGADFIGMIFYRKSPRYLAAVNAARVAKAVLPAVAVVGVFIDENTETILRTRDRVNLEWVQLHGSESGKDIRMLQREGLKVIKTFQVASREDWALVSACSADFRLVDNRTNSLPGGTGQTFDWSIQQPKTRLRNLAIAGGIDHKNVLEAIRIFRPALVDVSSSVESKPGIKSKQKLTTFFEVVNRARTTA